MRFAKMNYRAVAKSVVLNILLDGFGDCPDPFSVCTQISESRRLV